MREHQGEFWGKGERDLGCTIFDVRFPSRVDPAAENRRGPLFLSIVETLSVLAFALAQRTSLGACNSGR